MDDLTRRMAALGAPDPASWAESEIGENIAQQARYIFLRSVWPNMIDPYSDESVVRRIPAAARLLDAGATMADLSTALRAVAYETAFGVVERIDEGHDPDAPDDSPGWALMETDSEPKLTGRDVVGLHESLLTLDPSGREGSDLWE
jgi:hypothetical protein